MKKETIETPKMYCAGTLGMKMPTDAVAKRPPMTSGVISATEERGGLSWTVRMKTVV